MYSNSKEDMEVVADILFGGTCISGKLFTVSRWISDCFNNGYVVKQPVAWKEYCAEYLSKELQESLDRCTG